MKQLVFTILLTGAFAFTAVCQTSRGDYLISKGEKEAGALKFQQAIADYNAALIVFKDSAFKTATIYCDLASVETQLNHHTKALKYCAMANRINKNDCNVYQTYGYVYSDSGDFKMAITYYTKAIKLLSARGMDKDDSEALANIYNLRGDAYQRCRLYKKSIDDFNYSLLLDAKNNQANWARGNTYSEMGLHRAAVADYTKAMQFYKNQNADLSALYDCRAFDESRLTQYQLALDDENKAIEVDVSDTGAYFNRARIYFLLNDKVKGISDFNYTLKTDTEKTDRAFCLFFIGDTTAAINLVKHKLSGDADNSEEQMEDNYTLAGFMAILNKPSQAIPYLKKAIHEGRTIKYILSDPDFDAIRSNPAFIKLTKQRDGFGEGDN